MKNWKYIVDQQLSEIIGDGDVSHLPGAGKPLALKEDCHTPSEWRMAFKIMEDHEVIPDWIEAGKALELLEANLRRELAEASAHYLRQGKTSRATEVPLVEKQIESNWKRFKQEYRKRVEHYNREALLYNLKLPANLPHKQILNSEAMIERALESARSEM